MVKSSCLEPTPRIPRVYPWGVKQLYPKLRGKITLKTALIDNAIA